MKMKSMRDVMVRLSMLADQSGEKVSDARLEFTAERILPFGADNVCAALETLLDSSRRFPTVEEIKKVMGFGERTGRDLGNHIANLLIQAMGKFGAMTPGNFKQAKAIEIALGGAYEIVNRMGGWNLCCDRAGESLPHFIAQTRDLVESYSGTSVLDKSKIPDALISRDDAFRLAAAECEKLESPTIALIKLVADKFEI